MSRGFPLGSYWVHWGHGETRGFAVQHVPARDCGAGTILERVDLERAPGGTASLQRALATRQGPGGQGAVGTTEGLGSPGAARASRRGGPTRARDVRADAERANLPRSRAGDRALGARAHGRGETAPSLTNSWCGIPTRPLRSCP